MTRTRNTGRGRRTRERLARITALPLLALATSAQAQVPGSVQDFRLPPSSPSPQATAAGPVDTDHPVVAPPTTAPTAIPTPIPTIVVPRPVATTSAPAAGAPAVPRPERTPPSQAQPVPAGSPAAPTTVPTASVPAPALPTTAEPAPTAVTEPTPAPTLAPDESETPWPWIAGGAAAAVLLLGGFLLWRRRKADDEELEDVAPPASARPQPEPSPPAALTPPRREPAPAAVPPSAPPTANPRPLEMQLEARHLSRALVNATLAYRLTLINRTAAAIGPLRIAGDIVSAHASLPAAEQLAPGDAALATIHEVPSLAPGESVSLRGELRLPIASILPIQSGAARVFVPLARFRAEAGDAGATTRIFVVGQASEQPGGALRPFVLDRGPGVERGLSQRELEAPA